MRLFQKKNEKYDGISYSRFDEDSKIGKTMTILKKAIGNIIGLFRKKVDAASDAHYDLAVDEKVDSPFLIKQRVCNIIFLVYGCVAGIMAEEYAEYWCRCVQSFVTGVPITSFEQPPAHIVAILVGIIIVFSVYLSVGAVAGCLYFLIKATWLRNDGDDEIEMLQIAFMYAMLEVVLFGLFCFIIPFQPIISIKY